MSNAFSALAIGVGLTLTVSAHSAEPLAERGWSLEANVLDVQSSEGKMPYTFDGEETGIGLAGAYSFTKHLGLQTTYYDLGSHFATECPAPICTAVPHGDVADLRGLAVAAVGTWRVAPLVEVFGKVGVLATHTDFAVSGFEDSDRGALVGAGVGIWATPRWRINVQVERADFDLESAGVGMSYRF
jgi:hypothetical protein